MSLLSFVIPTYNEEESVSQLHDEICEVLKKNHLNGEIIFVNDGSTDKTLEKLESLHQKNSLVKIISLRCNSGKSNALAAGFNEAKGDIVFTLDADLQDNPIEIPNFLEKINEGYDLVSGWKVKRNDPFSRLILTRIYRIVVRLLTGVKIHDFNCGFKAYRKSVVKNIRVYGDLHRLLPVIAYSKGFKVTEIPVNHRPRQFGKSKYGMERIIRGPFDLLTTLFMQKYENRPLHFFGKIGAVFFIIGFIICTVLTIEWFLIPSVVLSERPLLILGVLFIIVGIQMVSTGLIGEMLTYMSHKDNQEFIIDRVYSSEDKKLAENK